MSVLHYTLRLAKEGRVGSVDSRVIVPAWAGEIEVERKEDCLWVTGWLHLANPLDARLFPRKEQARLDVLQALRRYGLRHLGQPRGNGGVYAFPDAVDDDLLVAFVREFGPVCGEVMEAEMDGFGSWTLKVREGLESLRREQRRFAGLVGIVQQVNLGGRADLSVLGRLLGELDMDITLLQEWGRAMEDLGNQGLITTKPADLLPMAHKTLCIFFNRYPPKLFPLGGEVIELPDVGFQGIRDALYYQLRTDYLAQRTIGTCQNCGHHFPLFKRATRGCSEGCRRALRNQKYWDKSKTTINAARRGKGKGGR
jgi:hypothetical protein